MLVRDSNPDSQRSATIESSSTCAWLYLSEPDGDAIEKDVWLYNLIPAPKPSEIEQYRGQAPPAPKNVIYSPGTIGEPTEANLAFRWSNDGEAVAVWLFNELHAFIVPESDRGYSRLLQVDCPWGYPIDFSIYDKHLRS